MTKLSYLLLALCICIGVSSQTYEEMVTRSLDYAEQKDYAAAEQALKAALRKEPANPNNAMLMVNLGTIQRNLGKLEEALISYNVAIEKYPDVPFIRHNRAALFCEMDRLGDAVMDYSAIILSDDRDVEALYRRGLIYLSKKDLFAAEDDFEKMIEIAPENLYGKMGKASVMKRRGEWKEAEEYYSDLIYKNKTVGELYFNRAECYLQLNRLARADEDIKKSLNLGYEDASVYILRGQLRLAQYDKQLAKQDFLKAKELGVNENALEDYLRMCK